MISSRRLASFLLVFLALSPLCLAGRNVILGPYYWPRDGSHWVPRDPGKTDFKPGDHIIAMDDRVWASPSPNPPAGTQIFYQLQISAGLPLLFKATNNVEEFVISNATGPSINRGDEGHAELISIPDGAQSGVINVTFYYIDPNKRGEGGSILQSLLEPPVERPGIATVTRDTSIQQPKLAILSAPNSVLLNNTFTLTANLDAVTYTWLQATTGGTPKAVAQTPENQKSVTYRAPAIAGILSFQVRATLAGNVTALSDPVSIAVIAGNSNTPVPSLGTVGTAQNGNRPAVATSFSFPTQIAVSQQFILTANANDPDGTPATSGGPCDPTILPCTGGSSAPAPGKLDGKWERISGTARQLLKQDSFSQIGAAEVRSFSAAVTEGTPGGYKYRFTVTDAVGVGNFYEVSVSVVASSTTPTPGPSSGTVGTPANGNQPAVARIVSPPTPTEAKANTAFTLQVLANDPDGTPSSSGAPCDPTVLPCTQGSSSTSGPARLDLKWERISPNATLLKTGAITPVAAAEEKPFSVDIIESTAGAYRYRLTVTDAAGVGNFYEVSVNVTTEEPINPAPTADFTVTPSSSIDAGKRMALDASASTGKDLTYDWEFKVGDSVLKKLQGKAVNFDVPLDAAGKTIAVTLTVTDSAKKTAVKSVSITVSPLKILVFPQFGDGDLGGGNSISSTLILVNRSTSQGVTGTVKLFTSDGNSLLVRIGGAPVNGTLLFDIPPQGIRFISTDGVGPLVVGSAQVSSSIPIEGTIVFASSLGTTAVPPSPALSRFMVPIEKDVSKKISTGVAIANPTTTAVTLTLKLRDTEGLSIPKGSATVTIAANGQIAKFPEEVFTSLGADFFSQFRGTLEISGPAAVNGMAIRLSPGQFTTLPVVAVDSN
jgi:hypothetical protein